MVRFNTRNASPLFSGGPHIPLPVMRMAPKPMRLTGVSPPIEKVFSNTMLLILIVLVGNTQFAFYANVHYSSGIYQWAYNCRLKAIRPLNSPSFLLTAQYPFEMWCLFSITWMWCLS